MEKPIAWRAMTVRLRLDDANFIFAEALKTSLSATDLVRVAVRAYRQQIEGQTPAPKRRVLVSVGGGPKVEAVEIGPNQYAFAPPEGQ